MNIRFRNNWFFGGGAVIKSIGYKPEEERHVYEIRGQRFRKGETYPDFPEELYPFLPRKENGEPQGWEEVDDRGRSIAHKPQPKAMSEMLGETVEGVAMMEMERVAEEKSAPSRRGKAKE